MQAVKRSDQLSQQLEQEQQLRSVAEACLMDNRVSWQHIHCLATDVRTYCTALQTAADSIGLVLVIVVVVHARSTVSFAMLTLFIDGDLQATLCGSQAPVGRWRS